MAQDLRAAQSSAWRPTPASSAWHAESPPPQGVPRLGPAPPVLTPEDLKKRAGFQYEGTANLKNDDLV